MLLFTIIIANIFKNSISFKNIDLCMNQKDLFYGKWTYGSLETTTFENAGNSLIVNIFDNSMSTSVSDKWFYYGGNYTSAYFYPYSCLMLPADISLYKISHKLLTHNRSDNKLEILYVGDSLGNGFILPRIYYTVCTYFIIISQVYLNCWLLLVTQQIYFFV